MDPTTASTLLAWMDREIWLVTAAAGGRRGGLIATHVGRASIVPDLPRVLVGVAKQHRTWELIESSGAFALHLLGERHLDLVWRFGLQSGRDVDKFAGLEARGGPTGSPILGQVIGWLDCRVEARLDTGDRTVYLGEVVQGQVTQFGPPLTSGRLMHLAPPERLSEMKRQLHEDVERDAEAIRAWRAGRT